MYGCAQSLLLRKDPAAETRPEPEEESKPALTLVADSRRTIDRETMLRLGLPASMIDRLLEKR